MKFKPSERYQFTYNPEWVDTERSEKEAQERLEKARQKAAAFQKPPANPQAEKEDVQSNEQSFCPICKRQVNSVAKMFGIQSSSTEDCKC